MKYGLFFELPRDYMDLSKIGVLSNFRGNGYGKALTDFARNFNLPIRTIPRIQSYELLEMLGCQRADQYVNLGLITALFYGYLNVTQRKVS